MVYSGPVDNVDKGKGLPTLSTGLLFVVNQVVTAWRINRTGAGDSIAQRDCSRNPNENV
jgi:hypothetical protein